MEQVDSKQGCLLLEMECPEIDLTTPLHIVNHHLPAEFDQTLASMAPERQQALQLNGMDKVLAASSRAENHKRRLHVTVATQLPPLDERDLNSVLRKVLQNMNGAPMYAIPFRSATAFNTPNFGGGTALVLRSADDHKGDKGNFPFMQVVRALNQALVTFTPQYPYTIHTSLAYLALELGDARVVRAVDEINKAIGPGGNGFIANFSSLIYTTKPGDTPIVCDLLPGVTWDELQFKCHDANNVCDPPPARRRITMVALVTTTVAIAVAAFVCYQYFRGM